MTLAGEETKREKYWQEIFHKHSIDAIQTLFNDTKICSINFIYKKIRLSEILKCNLIINELKKPLKEKFFQGLEKVSVI